MTQTQAEMLRELVRSPEFAGLVDEISIEECELLNQTMRTAIRTGQFNEAAVVAGQYEAIDGLPDLFKRYAERYARLANHRT